ncbi:hypothetical protein EON64_18490 [archaeon]|nr:MAG: hypothetical protein EON64_18490 [archaeon]
MVQVKYVNPNWPYLHMSAVPVFQLGVPSITLSGQVLMTAGLPVKFYTLDDSVVYVLKRKSRTRRDEVRGMREAFAKMKEVATCRQQNGQ